ncbi:response regulator, partial [bacterium]
MAIPPGFAAPVWPAAGLALAALLIGGDGLWPGLLLGHFVVNLSMGGTDPASVFLAAAIAAGGTLQALAGARLVRRWPGFPNSLARTGDILRFMLLAGPVACLVSPSVGTAALLGLGRVAGAEAPFSWGTWWVGDVLGVLLVAPALVLWSLPRAGAKANRPLLVTVPLACTLAAAAAVFGFARTHESRRIQNEFALDAASLHHLVEKETDVYLESLRSLRYFFDSSKEVDRGEFRTFTARPLARHPGFVALSWNPRGPSGGFPVAYIEPLDANRRALGFDVASEPVRREALGRAADSGEPAATGRVTLVQAPDVSPEAPASFLIALPIFTHGPRPADVRERRARLTGYVVGVLHLGRLVERALKDTDRRGVELTVTDDADPAAVPLYSTRPGVASTLTLTMPFDLPSRRWTARYSLAPEEYARRRSIAPWGTLVAVLSFALVLTVFLLLVTGHAETVEADVRERTSEIERQKTLLRSIIDNMGEGVAVADAAGKFLVFNAAAERIVGLGAVDAGPGEWSDRYGVFAADAVTPLPPGQNPLARALAGESTDDVELFVRNPRIPDGVYLAVTSRPLTAPDGTPAGGVAVFRDITARRRIADELRRAKAAAESAAEAKAAFLANMSHEIRTPMNAVVGMAGLLQDTPLNAEQKDFVATLRTAADGLLAIVNDILDFSRFEAGKVPLEQTDFDLRATVHEALRILGPQAEGKGLDLAFFCDPAVPSRLRGDPGRLRQVLLNLIGNAVKFTERGGVAVEARREGDGPDGVGLAFVVRDTGIGIPAEVQPALFSPFTQAETSTTRRFGGTGLGLAISKRIVSAMGGDIALKSRPGEGTEFSFTVRLRPAAAGPAPDRTGGLRGLKVLFADDNPVNRLILSKQLASWEMEAWGSEDAAQCWRLLKESAAGGSPFKLVILDHWMPDEDGSALARRIKADPDVAGTPLILLSSAGLKDAAPSFAARLVKPVNPSDLFNAILEALGRGAAPAPAEAAGKAPAFGHLKVLLVDDNPTNLKVAGLQLGRLGVKPDTASDGEAALAALSRASYDVVFMDCQMPVIDRKSV